MSTPEQRASQESHLRASSYWHMRLFRNNSGMLYNKDGVPVRYGLGNISAKQNRMVKSSDKIGFTPVRVTQEMVGKVIPVFTAIEDKAPSFKIRDSYSERSREAAQLNFINQVKNNGGIAGFSRGADDIDNIMKDYATWLTST